MATANDPIWIFVLMYAVLVITFISAVFSILQRKRLLLSIGMIVIIPVHHILQLVSSIGRSVGVTEMQHWMKAISQFAPWAIIVSVTYLFIVIWWVMVVNSYIKSRRGQHTSVKV